MIILGNHWDMCSSLELGARVTRRKRYACWNCGCRQAGALCNWLPLTLSRGRKTASSTSLVPNVVGELKRWRYEHHSRHHAPLAHKRVQLYKRVSDHERPEALAHKHQARWWRSVALRLFLHNL